MATWETVNW